jgi:ADP-ribosylglycohydrolase
VSDLIDPAKLRDRIRGSLLGGAIGDALGSAFEFVDSASIERAIGSNIVRDYHAALPASLLAPRRPGIPTDDTAMTLALIEALVASYPPTPEAMLDTLSQCLRRGDSPIASMFWEGGPGGACVAMLRHAHAGRGPFEQLDPNAGGNGAAMRAHPCGAFADRAFVADVSATQARLSHPHPAAVAAAQIVALVVHAAIYDGRLSPAIPPEIDDPTMRHAWATAHDGVRRASTLPAHLLDVDMAGWNTVSAAHTIAYAYRDEPAVGIGLAAASGRDTDTVASITGAMLGALHGARILPDRWIEGLEGRDLVERAAADLFQIVVATGARASPECRSGDESSP